MSKATRILARTAAAIVLCGAASTAATAWGDVHPAAARPPGIRDVAALIPRLEPALRARVAQAVVAEARLAGVDPFLVLALIHVESSFDPHAVSSAGAVGLMQLREETMRSEVERSGLRSADPHDPVASVQAGVRYLRRLIDAFGDHDLALMAYNAGPNRILGHVRRGAIPERFRTYPRKVKAHLERFRQAAAARAPAALTVVAASG
jgi:soluble lytic murein transglycosylase-like protein